MLTQDRSRFVVNISTSLYLWCLFHRCRHFYITLYYEHYASETLKHFDLPYQWVKEKAGAGTLRFMFTLNLVNDPLHLASHHIVGWEAHEITSSHVIVCWMKCESTTVEASWCFPRRHKRHQPVCDISERKNIKISFPIFTMSERLCRRLWRTKIFQLLLMKHVFMWNMRLEFLIKSRRVFVIVKSCKNEEKVLFSHFYLYLDILQEKSSFQGP